MRRALLVLPLLLTLGLLSACSSGSGSTTSVLASTGAAAPDDLVHGGRAAQAPVAFGATSTDGHGLAVTVAAPQERAEPAGAHPVQEWTHYVSVVVSLTNGGTATYDPQGLFVAVTSGEDPGEQVFGDGFVGLPATELAPGATLSFPLAFGVDDPAALSLEIAPDFSEPSALYRS